MEVETISPSYVDQNAIRTVPTAAERRTLTTRSGSVDAAPPDPVTRTTRVQVVRMVRQQPSIPPASADAGDETRSTDDSSSQASSSLKSAGTTSTTRRISEVSSHMRQRIRQQAKQMVEQKRDSAQLARRLQRGRSLQAPAAVEPASAVSTAAADIEDDVQIDRRIEDSIRLGAKYTYDEHSRVWPELIQRRFFFDETAEPTDDARRPTLDATPPAITHTRPRFPTRQSADAFRGSLASGPVGTPVVGETPVGALRDPMFEGVPTLFEARPPRDVTTILGHIGPQFLVNQGRDVLGFENITTNRLFRLVREGDEDDVVAMCGGDANEAERAEDVLEDLMVYRRPVDFEDQLSRRAQPLSRLDIDVNRVEFAHHWLYTAEDAAARALRTVFERYNVGVHELIALVCTYVLSRQQMDESDERPESQLTSIVDRIDVLKVDLTSLSQSVDSAWRRLTRVRSDASGQPLTRVVLRRSAEENAEIKSFLDGMDVPESLRDILRLPSFALDEDAEATRPQSKVVDERMAMLKKCRLQIEIYFNGIRVCSTDEIPLTVDVTGGFSVRFGRVFRLQVAEPPREICVRLRERVDAGVRTGWRELARVFVPLSNSAELRVAQAESATSAGSTIESGRLDVAEFASSIVHERHKSCLGCGSGAPFLNGTVYYSANWFSHDPADLTGKSDDSHAVSQSPSNVEFALIPDATALCSEEEFQSEFGQKPACHNASPAFMRQLSAKSRSGASASEFLGVAGADDFGALLGTSVGGGGELSLDAYRRVGHAYAVLIRRNLVESFALEHRLKTYSEIVHEESLPVLFRTFGTLFTPPDLSRKLKPMRLPTTATRAQTIRGTYRLIVNIQSASNLAERISGGPCHVFAEVAFQKSRARTTVVEGHYANWQETITLELDTDACATAGQKTNTFEPRAVTDAIELDIYDQIVTPFQMDDREPNTFHEQVENVWLGSVRIPFPTVYSMGKVDGVVALNRPLFTSGYKIPESRRQASVKLMVAVDPPLSSPQFNSYESFECGETIERLYIKAKKWETRLRAAFPDRRFIALANDSNGKRVLAQRFLGKITAPATIVALAEQNVQAAVSACVDLIASIPLTEDAVLFPGVCDVWTNAFEILKVGCGTAEEKAIFLTCILLELNLNASLVLGSALPEGLRAAYVLVSFEPPPGIVANSTTVLINPTNANCYTLDDPTIPLSVGTVLTTQNTFGNVQRATNPSLIDFDFKKTTLWQPLFGHNRSDLISVQTDVIRYVNASEDLLTDLRATLEREIKLHFDEARQYGIPQWNLLASRTLRDILQELWSTDMIAHEDAKLGSSYVSFVRDKIPQMRFNATIDVEQRLNSLRASYSIRASAFCCAYVSKRRVIDRVMKLRAHLRAHTPQIQHALAVHVHPFVNQLVTVSVAVAVLTPHSGAMSIPQSATSWTNIPFFPPHARENTNAN